jgi:cystathionine gamma-synthase
MWSADVDALSAWANLTGVMGAPFDSYMTLRGLRTLFPRIEHQQSNAAAVATFLERHPLVNIVHYPGLASHPGHAIAKVQQAGFGAMLSFELVAGDIESVRRFVEALEVFTLAESLGGVESLVAHPATMTHSGMGVEARRVAGISDNLLRLSIGLEAETDLIADLEKGLGATNPRQRATGL